MMVSAVYHIWCGEYMVGVCCCRLCIVLHGLSISYIPIAIIDVPTDAYHNYAWWELEPARLP